MSRPTFRAGPGNTPSRYERYAVDTWIPCARTHSVKFTAQAYYLEHTFAIQNTLNDLTALTLASADWNNSTVVRGDAVAEVTRLKQQEGQDLALYGHGRLAQTLLEHGLVDELRLSIHPVMVGGGQVLFRDGQKQALKFVGAKTFGTGVVVLTYQPSGSRA